MKKYLLAPLLCIIFFGCDREPAVVPAYLHIDEMRVVSDYALHGTASSKITTVWVEVDGTYLGVFELPVTVPIAKTGTAEVRLHAGINLNGIQSLRNIYEFYSPYEETFVFEANKDYWPDENNDSIAEVTYSDLSFYTYDPIEDFEGTALAFERAIRADTGLVRTTNPNWVFSDPSLGEVSTTSGLGYMPNADFLFEAVSIEEWTDLPKGGANVYVEMNYKSEAIITVGVYRRIPGQVDQVPVVSLFPSAYWNKIYINLVTEVSAIPNALGFRIFIGGINVEGNGALNNAFDNIKLVY